jgi:hypothetical protein
MDSTEDIEAMRKLHKGALEERSEYNGTYLQGYDGSWVHYLDSNDHLYDRDNAQLPYTYGAEVWLSYELNDGRIIKRRYNVWVDSPAGEITRDYLNRWEELNPVHEDEGVEYTRLERALENFENFNIGYIDGELPEICRDKEAALELLACIERDREEGNMAPHPYFHRGSFRYEDEWSEDGWSYTDSVGVSICSREMSWHVGIYPDAVHTVRWLKRHDLLDWEIADKSIWW